MINDLTNLLEILADAGVEFVLVGGFAGIVHGCTYVTKDIDICCDFSTSNLLVIQKALSELEPVHRMTSKRKKLHLTEKNCGDFKNLYLDTKIGQLDCLSSIEGIGDYNEVKQASGIVKLGGVYIFVLSLDALIKAKRSMNRPHDKEAIVQLEAIKKLKKSKNK